MTDDTDNVFTLIQGRDAEETVIETNTQSYYIKTIAGDEFVRDGFCVFTSHHLAVMRELEDKSAIPALVIPLSRLDFCELIEDDDEFDEDDLI